jgi:hypothetical protein
MDALDSRFFQHTKRRTIAALRTLGRIDLPDSIACALKAEVTAQRTDTGKHAGPNRLAEKLTP